MSTVSEAGNAGKITDPSTMTTEEALRSIATSLAVLTAALLTPAEDEEDEDAALPSPIPLGAVGHLALRDDGAILLSTEDCRDRDLSGRELVTCIVLTPEEVLSAHAMALDSIATAAAKVA